MDEKNGTNDLNEKNYREAFCKNRDAFAIMLPEIRDIEFLDQVMKNLTIEIYFYKQIIRLSDSKENPFNTILLLEDKREFINDMEYNRIKGMLMGLNIVYKSSLTGFIKDNYL